MWRQIELYRIGRWDCTIEGYSTEPFGTPESYRLRLRNPETRQVWDGSARYGKLEGARHALLIQLHNRRD